MIISSEYLENVEKNQINLWLNRNPMILDRAIVEIWSKEALKLEWKEG